MKALRLGFPWQGGGLLLGLLLWSLFPSPIASQDLASQLHASRPLSLTPNGVLPRPYAPPHRW